MLLLLLEGELLLLGRLLAGLVVMIVFRLTASRVALTLGALYAGGLSRGG